VTIRRRRLRHCACYRLFSSDSGVVGDGITHDNTLILSGTAAANSTVKIFDGGTPIGTVTADSSGSWDYITSVLTTPACADSDSD